jgi:hypothetical protein
VYLYGEYSYVYKYLCLYYISKENSKGAPLLYPEDRQIHASVMPIDTCMSLSCVADSFGWSHLVSYYTVQFPFAMRLI